MPLSRSKKKSRKKPITPVSHIKNVLRQLWLRSRIVKLQVHHKNGIDWDGIAEMIRTRVLSGELQPLCIQCHEEKHNGNN